MSDFRVVHDSPLDTTETLTSLALLRRSPSAPHKEVQRLLEGPQHPVTLEAPGAQTPFPVLSGSPFPYIAPVM